MIKIEVEGDLKLDFDPATVDRALRAEAPAIVEFLQSVTPEGATGRLKKGWKLDKVAAGAATFRTEFYGLFVNDGAKAHVIKGRPQYRGGKSRRVLKIGDGYARVVRHPGITARKFLEHGQAQAARQLADRIIRRLKDLMT